MRPTLVLLLVMLPVMAAAQPVPEPVALDLRPGSCPNPINARAQGVYPVAILGSDVLDVTDIDVFTVLLEGVSPIRSSIEDVSGPFVPMNMLNNPGFESPDASGGDVYGAAGWFGFNDHFTTATVARSGNQSLKIFGPFFPFGGAGAGQNIGAASEGEVFELSAWALNNSGDPIDPSNFAVVKLEFLDAGFAVIGFAESPQINSALPQDVWTKFSVQAVAPPGTAFAQAVLVHVQLEPVTGGSVFFDDVSMVRIQDCACSENGPDGFEDLTLKFSNQELVEALGMNIVGNNQIPMTITGRYLDGTPFEGTDCVVVRGGPKDMIEPGPGVNDPDSTPGEATSPGVQTLSSPSEPVQRLRFKVPEASGVRLKVFDTQGRLVASLIDSYAAPGSYEVDWDSSGSPNGVYFVKLEAASQVTREKIFIVR